MRRPNTYLNNFNSCIAFFLLSAFSEMGLLRVSQGLFEVLREQGNRFILNYSMLFDKPARMVAGG